MILNGFLTLNFNLVSEVTYIALSAIINDESWIQSFKRRVISSIYFSLASPLGSINKFHFQCTIFSYASVKFFHGPRSRSRFRHLGFRLSCGSHCCHYPLPYWYWHLSQYLKRYYILCLSFYKNSDAVVILYWFWTFVGICCSWRTVHCSNFGYIGLKLLICLDYLSWQLAVSMKSFHFSFSLIFNV